jgi:hypothetical protein
MLPDYYEYLIQRAKQQDLMREAARYRLAQYATQSRESPPTVGAASRPLVCRLPVLRTALCQTS